MLDALLQIIHLEMFLNIGSVFSGNAICHPAKNTFSQLNQLHQLLLGPLQFDACQFQILEPY